MKKQFTDSSMQLVFLMHCSFGWEESTSSVNWTFLFLGQIKSIESWSQKELELCSGVQSLFDFVQLFVVVQFFLQILFSGRSFRLLNISAFERPEATSKSVVNGTFELFWISLYFFSLIWFQFVGSSTFFTVLLKLAYLKLWHWNTLTVVHL